MEGIDIVHPIAKRLILPFANAFARQVGPRVVKYMAQTGIGTDECIAKGCLPVPVHFYQPIPDIADLAQRHVWDRESDLTGIDFRPAEQLKFLATLGGQYGSECDWPPHLTPGTTGFFTENNSFSFGCAAITHSIIRNCKPNHVIEIGSGNSSLIISSALGKNQSEGHPCDYTIVDPYPGEKVRHGLNGLTQLVEKRVELLDPSFFDQLDNNDILFIDSGHTVRIGGDVNFLFLDVLPRLKPGVVVHIHDIPMPFEYDKLYANNPSFRMFWTESYLLQAFLCHNSEWEVLVAMSWIMTRHPEAFRSAFPHNDPAKHNLTSGSFWIRRKPRSL